MKCLFNILIASGLILLITNPIFSQKTDSVYTQTDIMPDFQYKNIDSLNVKLTEYLRENSDLKILKSDEVTGAYKGLLLIRFIVEKNGTLSNIRINTFGYSIDKRKLTNLLINTQNWNPGTINGKAVRVALSFSLHIDVD